MKYEPKKLKRNGKNFGKTKKFLLPTINPKKISIIV